MRLQVQVVTEKNMGDHGIMARIAFDVDPDETVGDLVQRIADSTNNGYRSITDTSPRILRSADWIEIRQIPEVADE